MEQLLTAEFWQTQWAIVMAAPWVIIPLLLIAGLLGGKIKAERELRPVAVGRKNWTFAGSDEAGRQAAAIYTLIATAKLNDIDPKAWLADVLARLSDHPARRIDQLLPWQWCGSRRLAA